MNHTKLLIFHPVIAPYRIDLFNEFYKRYDAKIYLFKRNLDSQKFDYAKIEQQFIFKPTYIERRLGFFQWAIGIIRQLQLNKPQLVICSEFGIATLLVILFKYLTFKKYHIVSMVDDSYNMIAENNQFSKKHAWATRLITPILNNVINVEPRVVNYYKKFYNKGIFMPIIVDDIQYRQRLQKILTISESYVKAFNLEGKKILLFVGRLVEIKNVSLALSAFAELNDPKTIFVIVGDGPELTKLKNMAANNSNIIFTGRLEGENLYAWYNIANVFTLPSYQEPFGAVTNEALLGGCYALISKNAGSNCLIKENSNGNVIDPYNKNQYIELLEKALDRASPISLPLRLRPNGMFMHFQESFDKMQEKIM